MIQGQGPQQRPTHTAQATPKEGPETSRTVAKSEGFFLTRMVAKFFNFVARFLRLSKSEVPDQPLSKRSVEVAPLDTSDITLTEMDEAEIEFEMLQHDYEEGNEEAFMLPPNEDKGRTMSKSELKREKRLAKKALAKQDKKDGQKSKGDKQEKLDTDEHVRTPHSRKAQRKQDEMESQSSKEVSDTEDVYNPQKYYREKLKAKREKRNEERGDKLNVGRRAQMRADREFELLSELTDKFPSLKETEVNVEELSWEDQISLSDADLDVPTEKELMREERQFRRNEAKQKRRAERKEKKKAVKDEKRSRQPVEEHVRVPHSRQSQRRETERAIARDELSQLKEQELLQQQAKDRLLELDNEKDLLSVDKRQLKDNLESFKEELDEDLEARTSGYSSSDEGMLSEIFKEHPEWNEGGSDSDEGVTKDDRQPVEVENKELKRQKARQLAAMKKDGLKLDKRMAGIQREREELMEQLEPAPTVSKKKSKKSKKVKEPVVGGRRKRQDDPDFSDVLGPHKEALKTVGQIPLHDQIRRENYEKTGGNQERFSELQTFARRQELMPRAEELYKQAQTSAGVAPFASFEDAADFMMLLVENNVVNKDVHKWMDAYVNFQELVSIQNYVPGTQFTLDQFVELKKTGALNEGFLDFEPPVAHEEGMSIGGMSLEAHNRDLETAYYRERVEEVLQELRAQGSN